MTGHKELLLLDELQQQTCCSSYPFLLLLPPAPASSHCLSACWTSSTDHCSSYASSYFFPTSTPTPTSEPHPTPSLDCALNHAFLMQSRTSNRAFLMQHLFGFKIMQMSFLTLIFKQKNICVTIGNVFYARFKRIIKQNCWGVPLRASCVIDYRPYKYFYIVFVYVYFSNINSRMIKLEWISNGSNIIELTTTYNSDSALQCSALDICIHFEGVEHCMILLYCYYVYVEKHKKYVIRTLHSFNKIDLSESFLVAHRRVGNITHLPGWN